MQIVEETKQRETGLEWLAGLMLFCQAYGPPECFKGWHSSRLRDYLVFHLEAGTAVVQTSGQRVNGILIGWQAFDVQVEAAAELGQHPFWWQETNPDGDCIYLAECVARDRRIVPRLVGQLSHRFPEWASVSWLAYRHGKLVRLDRMAEGLGITRTPRSARRATKKGTTANV